MSNHPVLNEQAVEEALRGILEPLDRQLASVTLLFPLALVTVVPGVFFAMWWPLLLTARHAVLVSGGAFCILVAFYLVWEMCVAQLARWRFDRRFCPGTPERILALQLLSEMETPSKAEEKLRVALSSVSSDRVIRRRASAEVAPPDEPLSFGPPTLVEQPAHPGQTVRRGGYFDYIPLEPRSASEETSPILAEAESGRKSNQNK